MEAKIFIDKKQDDWFNKHGVYADTNSKIAEWMEEYAQLKVKESIVSEEDYQKEYDKLPYTKHLDDGQFNDGVQSGFEMCWEWMKSKLTK